MHVSNHFQQLPGRAVKQLCLNGFLREPTQDALCHTKIQTKREECCQDLTLVVLRLDGSLLCTYHNNLITIHSIASYY